MGDFMHILMGVSVIVLVSIPFATIIAMGGSSKGQSFWKCFFIGLAITPLIAFAAYTLWNIHVMYLLFWLVCAMVCSFIAERKNRSSWVWFAMGLLFSILAVVFVLFISPSEKAEAKSAVRAC